MKAAHQVHSPSVLLGAYGMSYVWTAGRYVKDISFELHRSEIMALLGPNGSGKSTLMKRVAGLLPDRPGSEGQVRYLGQDFLSLNFRQRAQKIVYVGAELKTEFSLRAEEVVFLGRTSRGDGFFRRDSEEDIQRVCWAMELCLCWDLRSRRVDSLSGGEKQRVNLARALAQGAQVLFLDEALSKMDLNHQAAMGKMLRSLADQGWSILMVSHDLNVASEWADSALFLKQGEKVCMGSIREVITQAQIEVIYPDFPLVVSPSPVNGSPKVFFGVDIQKKTVNPKL